MRDFIKWLLRAGFIAIFWVFALSINVQGRTIFSYANEALVQNSFVRMLDEELADLWLKVYNTARVTFTQLSGQEQKS